MLELSDSFKVAIKKMLCEQLGTHWKQMKNRSLSKEIETIRKRQMETFKLKIDVHTHTTVI